MTGLAPMDAPALAEVGSCSPSCQPEAEWEAQEVASHVFPARELSLQAPCLRDFPGGQQPSPPRNSLNLGFSSGYF